MEVHGVPAPPQANPPVVSIVLATLNEHENLPWIVEELRRLPLPPYEVIVVDDGSTDGTREYLAIAAAADPRIRPILHDGKQTTLKAQCQGILDARGRYVVIMDSDRQHPPKTVLGLLHELEGGAGLAIASRYVSGGAVGERSFARALISRGAEWTAKFALRDARRVTDPVSGFFAFRREVFHPVDPSYRGYKLLLFLLVMNHGRRVAEVGYVFEPRTQGASKVTQGLGFVRVFLLELILARRLERMLKTERRSLAARAEPTR